ncbi:MAG: enoyl-CoA hydratase/isomerase family protein, partial [Chloroflexi bacterium]|nr:enoyl-CoA hydratase/isomerase family protein [Chloroflexota bacterium]
MPYCLYEVDKATRVATITFNKPEKVNSMTTADMKELGDVISEAETDDRVAAILFRGAGKAFGSGFDIDEIRTGRNFNKTDRRPSLRERLAPLKNYAWGDRGLIQKVLSCDKATVGMVHGYCYGSHFEMATVFDYTIASEDAVFTHPGWRYLGIEGHLPIYILAIGWRRTKEMILLGKEMPAKEAADWGLINKVV